jgi:hypothetical protein
MSQQHLSHNAFGQRRTRAGLALTVALAALVSLIVAAVAWAAPSATTDPASDIHHTSAILHGSFDPDSESITDCYFDWGTTTAYGNTEPCAEGTSFSAPAEVSAQLSFLTPGETIHYRLHLETSSTGAVTGSDRNFTPAPFPITAYGAVKAFGDDGTEATEISETAGRSGMTFFAAQQHLFYLTNNSGSAVVRGFDASNPPAYPVLSGFPTANASGIAEGVAVDNTSGPSAGNVYALISSKLYGYDQNGQPLGGPFPINTTSPRPVGARDENIAVDENGDIWVSVEQGAILRYSSTGAFEGSIDVSSRWAAVREFDFDSQGNLYGFMEGGGNGIGVYRLSASSNYDPAQATLVEAGSEVDGVGVNRENDHVFVVHSSPASVIEFDAAGTKLAKFADTSNSTRFQDVAIDPTNGYVYVEDLGSFAVPSTAEVRVFAPNYPSPLPTLTERDPDNVTRNSATLQADVDPETMHVDQCYFEWGTTSNYTSTVPCSPNPGDGSGNVRVTADLSGLGPGTYHYRLVTANLNGQAATDDQVLITAPAVTSLKTLAADQVGPTSARLNGTLDPEGQSLSDCHFSWVAETDFQTSGFNNAVDLPCDPDPSGSSGETAVSADLSGLEPGTRYRFRLRATNGFGTTTGASRTFTTVGVEIRNQRTTDVSDSSASIEATIDPQGQDTTYHFEYTDALDFQLNGFANAISIPAPEAELAGSDGEQTVSEELTGLASDTGYRWRTVATNSDGTVRAAPAAFGTYKTVESSCPNAALRTGPSANLPDCRAYEQASPVDKGGYDIAMAPILTPSGGDRVAFTSLGAFADAPAGAFPNDYFAARGSDWSTTPIGPPMAPRARLQSDYLIGTSPDYTKQIQASTAVLAPGAAEGRGNLYFHDTETGEYDLLLTAQDVDVVAGNTLFVGSSADGSRMFFTVRGSGEIGGGGGGFDLNSTPPPPSGAKRNLYEYSDGQLKFIGILPDGSPAPDSDSPADGATDDNGGEALNNPKKGKRAIQRTVSADGDRIYWTTTPNGSSLNGGGRQVPLYLYDTTTDQSVLVSRRESDDSVRAAYFAYGTNAGDAFLTSDGQLTDDAHPAGADLYFYDADSNDLTDLTPGSGPEQVDAKVLGAAEDGSYVYFTATASLAPGAPAGQRSLYAYHDGETRYITTFAGTPDLGFLYRRVSANGQYLALRTGAQMTGPWSFPARAKKQAYFYDYAQDTMFCASCDPASGAPTSDDVRFQEGTAWPAQSTPPFFGEDALRSRNASDAGQLFFETKTALLAADVNNKSDVYEFSAGGELHLLSTGQNGADSYFGDASADGEDVYILTREAGLVGQDIDPNYDVYDVKADGGIAAQSPPEQEPCSGDQCQQPPTSPPTVDPPKTTDPGPGNPQIDHKRCNKLQKKARAFTQQARKLQKKARKLSRSAKKADGKKAHKLRNKAKHLKKKAKRQMEKAQELEAQAGICRNGGQS